MIFLRRTLVVCLLMASLLGLLGTAFAQTTLNIDGRWAAFTSGGQRQSASFALQDSFGYAAGTVSTNANTTLEGGFVVGVAAPDDPTIPTPSPGGPNTSVYLPLIVR
ncbi:MAG: hypothetical protein AAGF95_15055 [Chloroflexota bacterium]